MNDDPQVREIVHAVIALPLSEREPFLDAVCLSAAMRTRVEDLMLAHEQQVQRTSSAGVGGTKAREALGTYLGPFRLLEQIGEGGFGTVYLAEQTTPVRRRVALKILKLGMDSHDVVERFEAERQMLAWMDHPNIAKVLDGGTTNSGRPYFVMELVEGLQITDFCDRERLDTRERLELFHEVCQGVQHAHYRGIIHRDLKPSNVLVKRHEGVPVPRIIDFGIAKASGQHVAASTPTTDFGQVLGTMEYMAPEQMDGAGRESDTRVDVYSLGVLLYELLTGTKPFDTTALSHRSHDERVRAIREVDPPKPSTRLSTMGPGLALVAEQRHTPSKLLGRAIRGDLDWIVMKSIEKDPDRRYESAGNFAQDVQNYLSDEPVLAAPPSTTYRLRKTIRRNRLAAIAGAVVTGSIVLGSGLAYAGMREARLQTRVEEIAATEALQKATTARLAQRTEQEQKARADASTAQADRDRMSAARTLGFIQEMFASIHPYEGPEGEFTVRQMLETFDSSIGQRLASEPEVEASVHAIIGEAFLGLGLPDRAEPHLTVALKNRRALFGDASLMAAWSAWKWAMMLHDQGHYEESAQTMREILDSQRGLDDPSDEAISASLHLIADNLTHLNRLDEAEPLAREALDFRRKVYGNEVAIVGESLLLLGQIQRARGDVAAAEKFVREGMAIYRETYGDRHPHYAQSLNALAICLRDQGDDVGAEVLVREALAIDREAYGGDSTNLASSLSQIGTLLNSRGDLEGAEPYLREALAMRRRLFGNEHESVASSLVGLASLLGDQGNPRQAEKLQREALSIARKTLGDRHPRVADVLSNLGVTMQQRGKLDQAETFMLEALEIELETLGDEHPSVGATRGNLAFVKLNQGDLDAAEQLYREALAIVGPESGIKHPFACAFLLGLGKTLLAKGDLEGAEASMRAAHECATGASGGPDVFAIATASSLGELLLSKGKLEETEQLFRKAVDINRVHFGSDSMQTISALNTLGKLFYDQRNFAEAEVVVREILEHMSTDNALVMLGECLLGQGKGSEAEPYLREGLELRKQSTPGSWTVSRATSQLGESLLQQGKYEEAEPLLLEAFEAMSDPQDESYRQGKTLKLLIELYTASGQREKAAEWEAKR